MFRLSGYRVFLNDLTAFPPGTNIELLVQRKERVPILAGMVCIEIRVRDVQALHPVVGHQGEVIVAH